MDALRNYGESAAPTGVGLARGSMLRIRSARDTQVRVDEGTVWITQQDDTRDIVLQRGECFRLDRDGVALLTACGRTPLTLILIASES